jgi:hypothetical protein
MHIFSSPIIGFNLSMLGLKLKSDGLYVEAQYKNKIHDVLVTADYMDVVRLLKIEGIEDLDYVTEEDKIFDKLIQSERFLTNKIIKRLTSEKKAKILEKLHQFDAFVKYVPQNLDKVSKTQIGFTYDTVAEELGVNPRTLRDEATAIIKEYGKNVHKLSGVVIASNVSYDLTKGTFKEDLARLKDNFKDELQFMDFVNTNTTQQVANEFIKLNENINL